MRRNSLRACVGIVLAVGAGTSLAAQTDFTVLPPPSGELGVGTVVWHWPDPGRPDELTPDPGDVREVVAQLWYPTDTRAAEPTNVYAPFDRRALPTGVNGWSQPSAPFSSQVEKAPVILICPGSRLSRFFYTTIAEDLASHGYAVLAVDSPHFTHAAYPDGRVIPGTIVVPPELRNGPYEFIDRFWETAGTLGAGDMLLALENLEEVNKDDPARRLKGKLEMKHMGAFGHSIGARTCGGAVASHNKFVAFSAFDGAVPRGVREVGMDQVVLVFLGPFLPQPVVDTVLGVIPNRRNDVYHLLLDGFLHNNVNDMVIIDPINFPSRIDPVYGVEVTREVLRTFFDEFVKGTGNGTSSLGQIPGATLEIFPKPRGSQ